MPSLATFLTFGLVALGLSLTPGPNMIHLISRSLCQGPRAGMLALAGTAVGFLVYMACAAFGLTALFLAVPFAYDALRLAGAAYLLWLAWAAVRPGGRSPFATQALPPASPHRLFSMGLMTNLLNPKSAVIYLTLLPQFVDPARGHVLAQSLLLGMLQVCLSLICNSAAVLGAGGIARFLARRPGWAQVQRWLMGTVLAGLAVRMAVARR
jgi:threonine/homoserine/homoserine lactone efflux protein